MIAVLATAAVASALSAPEPKRDRSLWSPQDVPTNMIEDDITYYVGYSLIVDPHGRVTQCRIEESSGLPKLDSYTCKLASGRARLLPATDLSGKPVYGAYRELTSFWMGDDASSYKRRERYGDLEISVPAAFLPKGKLEHVSLALAVDERGTTVGCEGTKRESNPRLVELACPAAVANIRLMPVQDSQGRNVPSVQNVKVSVEPR